MTRLALLGVFTAGTAHAAAPAVSTVVNVPYTKERIEIHGVHGYDTMLVFEPEEIVLVTGGDVLDQHVFNKAKGTLAPAAWMYGYPEQAPFYMSVKPVLDSTTTNMHVLTKTPDGERRMYTFELIPHSSKELEAKTFTRTDTVHFTYPYEGAMIHEVRAKGSASGWTLTGAGRQSDTTRCSLHKLQRCNVNYHPDENGDLALLPTLMWDDGNDTFLYYAEKRTTPGVFGVEPDGRDRMLSKSTDSDGHRIVIHGVYPMFTLRSGQQVLCIKNAGFEAPGPVISSPSAKLTAGAGKTPSRVRP